MRSEEESDGLTRAGATGLLEITVSVAAENWLQTIGDPRAVCSRAAGAAHAAALAEGPPVSDDAVIVDVSILLTDDDELRRLNRDYRGKDEATNVLSFANIDAGRFEFAPDGRLALGDIAVALETVLRESEQEGSAPANHLSHMIVHGMLHLLGYDHETDREAQTMEAMEVSALASLGIDDPYAEPGRQPDSDTP